MKKKTGNLMAAIVLSLLCVGAIACALTGVTGVAAGILLLSFGLTSFLALGQWCAYL